MIEALCFAAIFAVTFGAFALTEGRRGRIGGNGKSFRQMVIEAPRVAPIQPPKRRERVATAAVFGVHAATAAVVAGLVAVLYFATR